MFCGRVFCQCAQDVSELSGSHQSWLSLVQQFDVHRHGTLIGKHSCKGIHAVLLRLMVGSSSVNVIQVRLRRADLKAAFSTQSTSWDRLMLRCRHGQFTGTYTDALFRNTIVYDLFLGMM